MPRILFVGMPDSIHLARWVNQLPRGRWDIGLFPAYQARLHRELVDVRVFASNFRKPPALGTGLGWCSWPALFFYADRIVEKIRGRECVRFREFALYWAIRFFHPHIVHSLEIQHSAYLTLPVMTRVRCDMHDPPCWVVTNWGSDIYLFGRLTGHAQRIRQVLEACDYYSCECQRDVGLARQMGLQGQVLPVIPNAGGFDLEHVWTLREPGPVSSRRLILLKGYQTWAGRALAGLRALARCAVLLKEGGYRIALYSASPEVKIAVELFQADTGIPVELIAHASHDDLLRYFGRARLYIGLSISDAISTSLLEAMVMGAFPIQSCTACTDEWIEDGRSGCVVPPEDVDIIEKVIRRALDDDRLVDQAAEINWQTSRERLDRTVVECQVNEFYKQVMNTG